VGGNIQFGDTSNLLQRTAFVEAQVLKDPSITFREVESGWIKLRGPLLLARIESEDFQLFIHGRLLGNFWLDPVSSGDAPPCEDTGGIYALFLFGH
jgi:hypothetical protein